MIPIQPDLVCLIGNLRCVALCGHGDGLVRGADEAVNEAQKLLALEVRYYLWLLKKIILTV